MIEFLNNLDTEIFLAINGAHSPFFDSFMMMFTGRFIWVPMYAMVLLILFKGCRWQAATVYLLALVAAICLTDQTCASVIRPAVERMRPSNIENTLSDFTYIVDGYRGGSYGFPSCHAANSFALATFVALFVKRKGFTLFILGWALLNSYSRLYLGVHYPGDLFVGAIVGSLFGLACYHAARLVSTRLLAMLHLPTDQPTGNSNGSNTILSTRLTASDMMIATFAVILVVIIITSAIHLF